ncbi:SAM-dependent methyltransferase [Nocardia sp. NBC_00403]|uniref:SAM-dependent methyltransferase n=1 Tax=Nocardia sp. NBC_00403 TaxID=2975990 RepID=UPI002E24F5CB
MTTTPEVEAAAMATNLHYERSAEAFAAFLGADVKYTCGLFATGNESLDEAQQASLALIAASLRLRGGEQVLDIGCGWGSLTLYLAREFGCRVVGVTPSAVQAEFIRTRARAAGVADLVEVVVGPFQLADLNDRRFDAVAMVEVVEHLPEHREPLRKAYRLLKRDGRLFISAFCYRSTTHLDEFATRPASMHALGLFGFTAMVPLSQLVAEISDAGFSIASVIDTTSHYDRTMDHWQQRITANQTAIEAVEPGFAAELDRYFDTARASWGHTSKLYAVGAVRSRMGTPESW